MMKTALRVEQLEGRLCPAATVNLSQGLLLITADNQGDSAVIRQSTPDTVEVLMVSEAGKTYDFAASAVARVVFHGGKGAFGDSMVNNTALPAMLVAGGNSGTNYLEGGGGNDTLVGDPNPAGRTYEMDFAGTNLFLGGAGYTNVDSGGRDTIRTGAGENAIYDLSPSAQIYATQGHGYIITGAGQVTAGKGYQIVKFAQPAAGAIATLRPDANHNGVLYLHPATPGAFITVNETWIAGVDSLLVSYVDMSSHQTFTYPKASVQWIALSATANDTFTNNTSVNDVFVGSAIGNDEVFAGFGVNVLHEQSGCNYLLGRGTVNDFHAGKEMDTLQVWGTGLNTFRVNEGSTAIGYNAGDVVLGVPHEINGAGDSGQSVGGNGLPTDAARVWWYQVLRRYGSI
jgi:hypothetical protein